MPGAVWYVCAGAGTLVAAVCILLSVFCSGRYDDIASAADREYVLMPGLIHIGCGFLSLFKTLPGEGIPGVKVFFSAPRGQENAFFMYYCFCASSVSLFLVLLPATLLTVSLLREPVLIPFVFILPPLPALYMAFEIRRKARERSRLIQSDIPSALSKLTLLISAGIVLRDAWETTSMTSDRPLYLEMRETSERMKNGMPEEDALYRFSQRCGIKEARQLASVLTPNLKKGSGELSASLRYLNGECWAEKKHRAAVEGKKAEGRLLLPLMIMFIGILIIIIVPLFSGIA